MIQFPCNVLLPVVAVVALGWTAAAAQGKTLAEVLKGDPNIEGLVSDIDNTVTSQGEDKVSVTNFQGDGTTSTGRAMAQVVKDIVKDKSTLDVVRTAKFTVKGDYSFAGLNEDTKRVEVVIKCRITERGLTKTFEIDTGLVIDDAQAIREIMGVTDEPPQASEDVDDSDPEEVQQAREEKVEEEHEQLAEAIENPKVEIADTVIQARPGSLFGIEILAAPEGADTKDPAAYAPRKAENDEGLAFVPLARGEVYAIRVINTAPYDVALTLAIDGINHFTFCDPEFKNPNSEAGAPVFSHLIIPAGTRDRIIKGWWKNHGAYNEFFVTENAKSASALVGVTDSIGTITATFAAAWESGEEPPADELPVEQAGSRGTGLGKEGQHQTTEVRRFVGAPRSIISVRYERE
jgi:hypothetical protein